MPGFAMARFHVRGLYVAHLGPARFTIVSASQREPFLREPEVPRAKLPAIRVPR